MLQMGIQPEKGEKNDMEEPSIDARPTALFSKAAYIPQIVHKEIMDYVELCRASSPDPYLRPSFLFAYLPVYKRSQVVLHHLMARGPVNIFMALFLDKCLSTRKLIFP